MEWVNFQLLLVGHSTTATNTGNSDEVGICESGRPSHLVGTMGAPFFALEIFSVIRAFTRAGYKKGLRPRATASLNTRAPS